MNVGYLLANSAAKFPQIEGVVSDQGRWTFSQFEDRAARLAGAMLASGLKRGDRVAILFYNGSPFVETYFAAVRVGLVATPVNFRFVGEEIAYILNDSGASCPVPRFRVPVCGGGGSGSMPRPATDGLSRRRTPLPEVRGVPGRRRSRRGGLPVLRNPTSASSCTPPEPPAVPRAQ